MPAFESHTTGTADVAWDAGEQEKKVKSGENRAYYGKIYAWYDPDLDEGNKSTYKFIHHEVSSDGEPGDAVIKACTSGIGVLNGGMGGTTIPDADRQGVYDHLAKHLRDADREPPPLNSQGQLLESARIYDPVEVWRRASTEVWAIWQPALFANLFNPIANEATPDRMAKVRPGPKSGGVVQIPIFGAISHREDFWSWLFGGTTVESLIKTIREVALDDSIQTVLLNIDSPGGTVSGIPDLADEVRKLAETKQVVALANDLIASAAYWIAAQADEIVATPEAMVGSIGVYMVHEDWSKFMDEHGIKVSYITAGKYKAEGNSNEPLSLDARMHLQSIVNEAYDLFVNDVAKGRKINASTVRSDYGEGRLFSAKDAKASGLVDRIAGYDETIRRLKGSKSNGGNSQARIALMRRRLEIAQKIF